MERLETAGWPRPPGAARPWAGAGNPDRGWACRSAAREAARPRRRGAEEKIRFTSSILPTWARRTPSLDALLPILYLRGVSMGDFQEALAALLGNDAPNLSPSVIARLRGSGRRIMRVAAARPVGPALRVCLGRRCLPAGTHGDPGRVHAGADRRDARGQEGTGRLPGGDAGERTELAGTAGRHQGARIGHRARTGHRRRGTRLLEGP